MSRLEDPRVLFAAERTLMAWSRTAAGLMAFGFVVDRTALLTRQEATSLGAPFWIGLSFVVLGVLFSVLSIMQYRRSIASLSLVEIPPGYWTNLTVYASGLIALLGIGLAFYLITG